MEYLFAPMEGITYGEYRLLHREMFSGVKAYYSPFIAPDSRGNFKKKYLRELTFDGMENELVPQLLVNSAEAFNLTAVRLLDIGFREINLNAGCPSGTVFSKHKGAGMLSDLVSLDRILDGIYEQADRLGYRVSIKTRMGVQRTDEFTKILEVFNRYPVSELIVHARSREDYYTEPVSLHDLSVMAALSKHDICYNGDIGSKEDVDILREIIPDVRAVMIGRKAVANPAIFRQLHGGEALSREELRMFHDRLLSLYLSRGLESHYAVERMKTLWAYMKELFGEEANREIKSLFKAKKIEDYQNAVNRLFECGSFSSISRTGIKFR